MHGRANNAILRKVIVDQAGDVAGSVRWPGGRLADPGRALTAYCMARVPYVADTGTQSIRRPGALVELGLSGDCKSTAVFIGGLSRSLGRRVCLRFVKYDAAWFQHVYAVVDGVPCDPLQGYGVEEAFMEKEDTYI